MLIDAFSLKVPSEIIAILLLVAATVVFMMGFQSAAAGLSSRDGRAKWRRLDVRLGYFLLMDALVFAIIALQLLRGDGDILIWEAAVVLAWVPGPFLVFDGIAHERREEKGKD